MVIGSGTGFLSRTPALLPKYIICSLASIPTLPKPFRCPGRSRTAAHLRERLVVLHHAARGNDVGLQVILGGRGLALLCIVPLQRLQAPVGHLRRGQQVSGCMPLGSFSTAPKRWGAPATSSGAFYPCRSSWECGGSGSSEAQGGRRARHAARLVLRGGEPRHAQPRAAHGQRHAHGLRARFLHGRELCGRRGVVAACSRVRLLRLRCAMFTAEPCASYFALATTPARPGLLYREVCHASLRRADARWERTVLSWPRFVHGLLAD